MITLANGAKPLAIDIRAFSGPPQGVVLAETETDYVTWWIWLDDRGWQATSGNYFRKGSSPGQARKAAKSDYDVRRGVSATATR